MAAVPKGLIPMAHDLGVETFSQVKPQMIQLKPQVDGVYRPGGMNTVSFKIPSFSNSWIDTSRSFISFNIAYETTTSITDVFSACRLNNGSPVFKRLTLKSSAGLVLDEIDQYDVFQQLQIATMPVSKAVSPLEGRDHDSVFVSGQMNDDSCFAQKFSTTGFTVRHYIHAGLLSRHTNSWIPVGLMGGSGYALDLDLQLNDNTSVISQAGSVTSPTYRLKNVVYNMAVMTLDESLCKKFNTIACDGREIKLAFNTIHAHTNVLGSNKNVLKIHESATSLNKISNVFLTAGSMSVLNKTTAYNLIGGSETPGNRRITRYNGRIGGVFVYSTAVEEEDDSVGNTVTMTHIKNSLGYQDEQIVGEYRDENTYKPSSRLYSHVFDFRYSGEKFLNGVSSSTPFEMFLDCPTAYNTGDMVCHSFADVSYNLVISSGQVRYEEPRPGSNSVYS
jgi:hypothetical protein